jgi:hypothetical protein
MTFSPTSTATGPAVNLICPQYGPTDLLLTSGRALDGRLSRHRLSCMEFGVVDVGLLLCGS